MASPIVIVVMIPLLLHCSFAVAPLLAPPIAILPKTASQAVGVPLAYSHRDTSRPRWFGPQWRL